VTATRQAIALAVSVGICLGAAGIGSVLTISSLHLWYATLRKPAWTPPNSLFGPVWTALYLGMAVAAWLVWRQVGFSHGKFPLTLFAVQLALNVAWSGIFFRLRSPGAAFLEVVLLWLFILSTAIAFWPVSRTASWLLVPYLTWATYAAALNAAIWRMNA
jgi:tryptophan-rich sensory protein